jgi:hypothetical protein
MKSKYSVITGGGALGSTSKRRYLETKNDDGPRFIVPATLTLLRRKNLPETADARLVTETAEAIRLSA